MAIKTRVLVVDDSALMRGLLSQLINVAPDMEVVGAAPDAACAREMIKALNPDVLTLDVQMPKMDGLEFLERLMRLRPTNHPRRRRCRGRQRDGAGSHAGARRLDPRATRRDGRRGAGCCRGGGDEDAERIESYTRGKSIESHRPGRRNRKRRRRAG